MSEHLLIGLAGIISLGIAAQWLSWRLHLPSILVLLIFGFGAGPVFHIINPDELFGELLFPLVSVSVGIVLFEGGLSLRFRDLKTTGHEIRNMVTIGILITWVLIAAIAYFLIGLQLEQAALIGAILIVTGPTVIIPLLRQVRPSRKVAAIVKWEGIINDPIGAILAVLVFEAIVAVGMQEGTYVVALGVAKALFLGGLIGVAGAALMIVLLRFYLIPDYLQNPVSLMVVVISFAGANVIQPESGLLAVTVMGVALANQKYVSIKHIIEFKENLRVILISSLFIILSARITVDQLALFKGANWIFVAVLIIAVRPIAVYLSTIGSKLKFNEKTFIAWMAPRGIVAAAVSSVFAVRLEEIGFQNSEIIVPLVFQVIIGTVVVYGLSASPVARLLKVSEPNPQGVLFIGAQDWAQEIARVFREEGLKVALVDSNWSHVTEARKTGCLAYYGNALSDNFLNEIELDGIGKLFALTSNDEVNSLAALHFADLFERNDVFQIPPKSRSSSQRSGGIAPHLRGRFLFDEKSTFDYLSECFNSGAVVKRTDITEEFNYDDFIKIYKDSYIPVALITESKDLKVFTVGSSRKPQAGEVLVSIVKPEQCNITPGNNGSIKNI